MVTDAGSELKKIIKIHTKKKKKPVSVYIKVREAKDIIDLKIKDVDEGIKAIRVHSTNKNFPKWYLHGYLIDIKNLRLDLKKMKKKRTIQKVLRNPSLVSDESTRDLLEKLDRDYGGIIPYTFRKLYWQTEYFKKKKDPFRVKMKTLN